MVEVDITFVFRFKLMVISATCKVMFMALFLFYEWNNVSLTLIIQNLLFMSKLTNMVTFDAFEDVGIFY